jgi:L-ribulose-5-phosphate 3-epimerase
MRRRCQEGPPHSDYLPPATPSDAPGRGGFDVSKGSSQLTFANRLARIVDTLSLGPIRTMNIIETPANMRGDPIVTLSRRTFLQTSAAGLAGMSLMPATVTAQTAADVTKRIRVGARQASFGGNLEVAARCGLDGVELGVGEPAENLRIADPVVRREYKRQVKSLGLVVSSLSMDLLNSNPLVADPRASAWLAQTIDAAKDLGAVGILVPFFGKGQLKKSDVAPLVERMKAVAPKAKAAGVVLGLENRLSAAENLEILDRIGSDAVRVYYDIGNSSRAGRDVPAELRQLRGRLCMIHFKDGQHYLGEGTIKMEPIAEALRTIGYQGWIVLETSCPRNNGEIDCKRNAAFVRKLLELPAK